MTLTEKSELDHAAHVTVETQLKHLKQASRQLREQHSLFSVELQFLQRFYYKGNNQHRSSTFWQRLCEIRRYAVRLDEIDLVGQVDSIRTYFFGPGAKHKYDYELSLQ
jgi:hypothetical protein